MVKTHIGKAACLILMTGMLMTGCALKWTAAGQDPVKLSQQSEVFQYEKTIALILEHGSADFFAGYPADETFLQWVGKKYGQEKLMDIAYALYEGQADADLWYESTGNSMHVLWLTYCEDMQLFTYYLENIHWIECKSEDVVTIDFTGDINLADDWYTMQALNQRENGIYDCIAPEIVTELQGADLSVINNEFSFTDGGERQVDKTYTFAAKTQNAALLEAFGADLANLANNHTFDYSASGLLDTLDTLKKNGIQTMGAGKNIAEASAIQYYIANGRKIAFVSATEIEKFYRYTKEATATEPGVLKTLDPTLYHQVIAEASKNSDYVIANVHWGIEGNYHYDYTQKELAEGFVEAGADVIIGGHPHRMQGVEFMDGVPVVYSMGNFWFSTGTLYTTIVQLQIDREGDLSLCMIPCIQRNLKTSMLQEDSQREAFYKFVADISYGVIIDQNGCFYNSLDEKNESVFNGENYYSAMDYASYDSYVDLDGRSIDIIGNLK